MTRGRPLARTRPAAMRSPRRWAPLRLLFGALVAGVLTSAFSGAVWGDTTTTTPDPITIAGVGSWAPYRELVTWQNALQASAAPVDLQYVPHGTLLGRSDFLQGNSDFVLSGTPFTSDELSQLPDGAKDLIVAPVQVATMGALIGLPYPNLLQSQVVLCDPDDPDTWPPGQTNPNDCLQTTTYKGDSNPAFSGDLKIPVENLAAMLMRYQGQCPPPKSGQVVGVRPLNGWYCYPVLDSFGLPENTTWSGYPSLGIAPSPVLRSDGDEMNYYLQQFVKQEAPTTWQGLKDTNPGIDWEPITERVARIKGASRDGAHDQAQMLGASGQDPVTGGTVVSAAGTIAPVPPSSKAEVEDTFGIGVNPLTWAEVQNKAGEWVGPTPAAINADADAAAAAGQDPFLYGFNNSVPNAYPLVWIDNLYVRSSGLSVQKTEILATVIRYLATDGQAHTADVGEGRLPTPLVTQALAAADKVVSSNCPAKDVVKSSDPGPYAPVGAGMKAIGTMLHCVAPATPTTTPPTTPSFANNLSSPLSTGASPTFTPAFLPAGPATAGATAPVAVESKTANALSAALTVAKLPLPEPSPTGQQTDVVATALAGAVGFLLLRIPGRRLLGLARR